MAAIAHAGDDGGREHEQSTHHDVERAVVLGEVGCSELRVQAESGVVDEQVDRSARVGQPLGDARDVGAIREVGDQHLHVTSAGTELLCALLETVGGAGDEHEVVAPGSEGTGESGADPGGSSCDEGCRHVPYDTVQESTVSPHVALRPGQEGPCS